MYAVVFSGDAGVTVAVAKTKPDALRYAFNQVHAEIIADPRLVDEDTKEMFRDATTDEEREAALHAYFEQDEDWYLDIVQATVLAEGQT
jgi:hypothetical protein